MEIVRAWADVVGLKVPQVDGAEVVGPGAEVTTFDVGFCTVDIGGSSGFSGVRGIMPLQKSFFPKFFLVDTLN